MSHWISDREVSVYVEQVNTFPRPSSKWSSVLFTDESWFALESSSRHLLSGGNNEPADIGVGWFNLFATHRPKLSSCWTCCRDVILSVFIKFCLRISRNLPQSNPNILTTLNASATLAYNVVALSILWTEVILYAAPTTSLTNICIEHMALMQLSLAVYKESLLAARTLASILDPIHGASRNRHPCCSIVYRHSPALSRL